MKIKLVDFIGGLKFEITAENDSERAILLAGVGAETATLNQGDEDELFDLIVPVSN